MVQTFLLIFGLLLSVLLVGTVATFFADYIKKHKWIGFLGLAVIIIVALQLIAGGIDQMPDIELPKIFKVFI